MKKSAYKLDFAIRNADLSLQAAPFRAILKQAIILLRKNPALKPRMQGGVIHLVLTDDRDIALLNALYRGKAEPTDVISLSYFDELNFPGEHDLVGEIMISIDTARKQARKNRYNLEKELRVLFAHGLLHLFGFDHQSPAERHAMFTLQDAVLAAET